MPVRRPNTPKSPIPKGKAPKASVVSTDEERVVSVEVSMNNQQYSMGEVSFEYQGMASVTSLEPVKGPAEGGTFVVVRGVASLSGPLACNTCTACSTQHAWWPHM